MTTKLGHGFESLEERTLLAANVTATLVGHTLYVTGDGTDNDIELVGDGLSGHVSLDTNGQTLTVNGAAVTNNASGAEYDFTGVWNIVVNTNGGDDDVYLSDVNLIGNVAINGGAGEDFLEVESVNEDTYIGGNVIVSGGLGTGDFIEVETEYGNSLTIGGNVVLTVGQFGDAEIVTEGSGDIVIGHNVVMNILSGQSGYGDGSIYTDGYGDITVGGNVVMNGGAGNDDLEIYTDNYYGDISITGVVTMNGNGGDDYLAVYTDVDFTNITTGSILINGGTGKDTIEILNGGFGNDTTSITTFGVVIQGGAGNDTVEAEGVDVLGNAAIWGGAGNDKFCAENNSVLGSFFINGGSGYDEAYETNNNVGLLLAPVSIEAFLDYCPIPK